MKSLMVFTENYQMGGGNRYMVDLVNAIGSYFDKIIITSNYRGIYEEDIKRLKMYTKFRNVFFITISYIRNSLILLPPYLRKFVVLLSMLFEPIFLLCNILRFILLIREIKPKLILCCNGGYPASQACLAMVIAANILNIKVVLSIVSMPSRRRRFLKYYDKLIDSIIWKSVNRVIVNANSIETSLVNDRDMPIGLADVIYNGIEDIETNKRKDVYGKTVIGCVARMDVSKGVLYLFDAFADLAKDNPGLQLILAGHGDASEELLYRCKKLGLEKQVKLLGHYTGNVSELIECFDIYIFPSLWEGFPYSIIEALRSGSVIIATKVGGIPEAISDGEEGILIKPGSKDTIKNAIESLIENPEKCIDFSQKARNKFESMFVIEKMNFMVKDIFQRKIL